MNSAACGGVKNMEFASTSAQSRRIHFAGESVSFFRQFYIYSYFVSKLIDTYDIM